MKMMVMMMEKKNKSKCMLNTTLEPTAAITKTRTISITPIISTREEEREDEQKRV